MSGECIFGTDGIRDRAGEGLLEAGQVRRIMQAMAFALRRRAELAGDFPEGSAVPGIPTRIEVSDFRSSPDTDILGFIFKCLQFCHM